MFKTGNPGRPKGSLRKPLLDWCRNWAVTRGETELLKIAHNPKHKNQFDAIKLIYAYAIGKPIETVEASHQFEGVGEDPRAAKDALDDLIAEATGGGSRKDKTDTPGDGVQPASVHGPEREAGGSDTGSGEPGKLHNPDGVC